MCSDDLINGLYAKRNKKSNRIRLTFIFCSAGSERKKGCSIVIKVSNPSYIKSQRIKRLGETWTYSLPVGCSHPCSYLFLKSYMNTSSHKLEVFNSCSQNWLQFRWNNDTYIRRKGSLKFIQAKERRNVWLQGLYYPEVISITYVLFLDYYVGRLAYKDFSKFYLYVRY